MAYAADVERVRIDKWVWAARFFKTRSLATDAAASGRIEVNGERAKPAKLIQHGDIVRIRVGPDLHVVEVRGLAERRGSAAQAQVLYEETPESLASRMRLAEQRRVGSVSIQRTDRGRPTKRDRRELNRLIDPD